MNKTGQELIDYLRTDHQRTARLQADTHSLLAAAVIIAVLILLFAADAFLILPTPVRGLLALGWLTLFPLAWRLRQRSLRAAFDPEQAAQRIEQRGQAHGDEIVNAVQLARSAPPGTSESLRQESVTQGTALARATVSSLPPDPAQRIKARRIALALGGLALLLALAQPKLIRDVGLRYLHPAGDHPPWSRLVFELNQQPLNVPLGYPVTLRIGITGPRLPDRAYILFPDESGAERIPLLRSGATSEDNQAGFSLHIPRADAAKLFYIDTPLGRSRRFLLNVSSQPVLERAIVRTTFPAYTGWAPREERVTTHQIKALRGSRVTLQLAANLPLAETPLTWHHADRHPDGNHVLLQPILDQPRRIAGTWTAVSSDSFEVLMAGADGQYAAVPFTASFIVDPDRPPEVRIDSPEPQIIAPEGWTVDLAVVATDDIGVARVEMNVELDGSFSVHEVPLPADRANPAVALPTFPLNLEELGAAPGSLIRYYATAFDNHPDPSQSADSAIGVIHVVSREDYDEFMRQQYRLEDWLEEINELLGTLLRLRDRKQDALQRLNDLLEQAEADPGQDWSDEIRSARAQLERFQEDIEGLAAALTDRAELDQLYDWEAPYKEWLRETAAALEAQHQAAGDVRQTLTPESMAGGELALAMERFALLEAPFGGLPDDHPDVTQDWQEMADTMRLLDAIQRLQSLIQEQRDLADRMGDARQRPADDPATHEILRRLGTTQEALQQELGHVQEAIRQAADAVETGQPDLAMQARQLSQAIDTLAIKADQQQAASAAQLANARRAARHADQAATKLESLIGQCNRASQGAGECLASLLNMVPPGLAPSIEDALRAALSAQPGLSLGRVGLQGAGSGGLMSTVGMVGPQYPIRGQSVSLRAASRQGRGGSGGPGGLGTARPEAETIELELPENSFHHAPAVRTIPLRYRRHAAAYFERLHRDENPDVEGERP